MKSQRSNFGEMIDSGATNRNQQTRTPHTQMSSTSAVVSNRSDGNGAVNAPLARRINKKIPSAKSKIVDAITPYAIARRPAAS